MGTAGARIVPTVKGMCVPAIVFEAHVPRVAVSGASTRAKMFLNILVVLSVLSGFVPLGILDSQLIIRVMQMWRVLSNDEEEVNGTIPYWYANYKNFRNVKPIIEAHYL